MKPLGTCWLARTKNGRCRGRVQRWVWLVGGNWRTPVEVWVCEGHEGLPFTTLLEFAEATLEVKTSESLTITPLRKVPRPSTRPRTGGSWASATRE